MVYGCTSIVSTLPGYQTQIISVVSQLLTTWIYILSNYTTNYYTTRPTIALQHDQYKFDMFERE